MEKGDAPDICETEFPPPSFLDDGELAVDGCKYHHQALIEDQKISIGDSTLILANEHPEFPYIAKISKIYETKSNELLAKVIWYWRWEDLQSDCRTFILRRELLASERSEVVPLDSIKSTVTVYASPDPLGKLINQKSSPLTKEFFCTRGFLEDQKQFIALSTLNRLLRLSDTTIETVGGFTKYDMARARLQLNYVQTVAGREKEIEQIHQVITRFLRQGGAGGCLYISGVPGTGKTLCVREVVKQLAKDTLDGKVSDFDYFEINCLRLESPREIYTELWSTLSGETLSSTAAQKALNESFSLDPPRSYILLLVDEVDVLLNAQQNELYCILEWASLPRSRLIVVAVANLMDLESRLKPKIASRMGKDAVKFFAYKEVELKSIVNSRVEGLEVFNKRALELCCKKIANSGGDARKCLEVCKRSIDFTDSKGSEVQNSQMNDAFSEITAVRGTGLLKILSEFQKLVLTAILKDMKVTGRSTIPVKDVVSRAVSIACAYNSTTDSTKDGKIAIRKQQILSVIDQLIELRIVRGGKDGAVGPNSTVTLIAVEQDALSGLKGSSFLLNILNKE